MVGFEIWRAFAGTSFFSYLTLNYIVSMILPFPTASWVSILMYTLLIYIIYIGVWQFRILRIKGTQGHPFFMSSLVPIGAVILCLGFLGHVMNIRMAFEAIEAAGDISPEIVAGSLKNSFNYVILGFLSLGFSFLFKYLNSKD